MKALIVDDDLALADVVSFTMRRAGFEVIVAHDGQTALDRWREAEPDLIILDINLPKLNGLAVCQRIRSEASTPIIILSVRGEEDDVVKGLELGADDYIVKPFSPRQLVARSEAVLRRSETKPISNAPLTAGDLTLDLTRNEIKSSDKAPIRLTKLETRLMEIMMINPGQVLPFDMLIDSIWGPASGDRVMLKQLVYRLRRKVEPDPAKPCLLITISGIGYSLEVTK
ncbi:MAG: response regulator transcription factor [Anaerolineales bacterium]